MLIFLILRLDDRIWILHKVNFYAVLDICCLRIPEKLKANYHQTFCDYLKIYVLFYRNLCMIPSIFLQCIRSQSPLLLLSFIFTPNWVSLIMSMTYNYSPLFALLTGGLQPYGRMSWRTKIKIKHALWIRCISLIISGTLWDKHYIFHFIVGKTEAQGG